MKVAEIEGGGISSLQVGNTSETNRLARPILLGNKVFSASLAENRWEKWLKR